jgi:tetratricopeptide (TPR) repeat protein
MRLVLWCLLIFILCLPMLFVLLLFPAAKYAAMDSVTTKLPMGIRRTVAELTLRNTGYGKDAARGIGRAIQLDPESADAWTRLCHTSADGAVGDMATCQKAIALDPSAWNFNGLGTAQERAKDYCSAEDSYTLAIKRSSNEATYLRNMARAALRCGHTGASVAGFEVAEGLDAKAAASPDGDDDDIKDDLATDREYLAIAYNRTGESVKAISACRKAHPDWENCHCDFTETGAICTDKIVRLVPKK